MPYLDRSRPHGWYGGTRTAFAFFNIPHHDRITAYFAIDGNSRVWVVGCATNEMRNITPLNLADINDRKPWSVNSKKYLTLGEALLEAERSFDFKKQHREKLEKHREEFDEAVNQRKDDEREKSFWIFRHHHKPERPARQEYSCRAETQGLSFMNATDSRPPLKPEIFCHRLFELRTAAGLGVNELARKAGVLPSIISRAENGHGAPSWATVLALANALGCTPNDFARDN